MLSIFGGESARERSGRHLSPQDRFVVKPRLQSAYAFVTKVMRRVPSITVSRGGPRESEQRGAACRVSPGLLLLRAHNPFHHPDRQKALDRIHCRCHQQHAGLLDRSSNPPDGLHSGQSVLLGHLRVEHTGLAKRSKRDPPRCLIGAGQGYPSGPRRARPIPSRTAPRRRSFSMDGLCPSPANIELESHESGAIGRAPIV